jgi:hypothetical protein
MLLFPRRARMNFDWFFKLAKKDIDGTLTESEKVSFSQLLKLYDEEIERLADEYRINQIAGLLGEE